MEPLVAPIVTLLILVGLWIFRREVTKLVDWIVQFRRIEKTKDGYSVQGTELPVPPPTASSQQQQLLDVNKDQLSEAISQNAVKDDETWLKAYINHEYLKAAKLIDKEVMESSGDEDRLWLRSLQGSILYLVDATRGSNHFKDLIKRFPTNIGPYQWWAISLRRLDQFDQALEVLDQGMLAVTDKASLIADKMRTLRQAGRAGDGMTLGLDSLVAHPTSEPICLALAELYLQQDSIPQAVNILERALAASPRSQEVRSRLASIFMDNNAPEHAAYHYAILTDQFPTNPKYFTLLGNAYLLLSYHDRAMIKYREANRLAEEKEGWIIGNIGNLLHNRGLHAEAIEYLERATQISPESEYAHQRLSQAIAARDAEEKKAREMLEKVAQRAIHPLPEHLRLTQS